MTQKRVVDLLLSVPTHKATGDDGISAKIFRIAAPAISPSLTKLMNLCLLQRFFLLPGRLQRSRLFSKEMAIGMIRTTIDRSLYFLFSLKYYRNTYVNTRVTSSRRMICFTISSLDLGKSYSTETALIRLVDQLLLNLDNDKATGLVLIDYKKAFDLIDHQLLLSKLGALGVSENHLPLFYDYLNGRSQYVNIDGYHSTRRAVTLGVPQDSISGPVLFLVFINDLSEALQHSAADIYGDDTTQLATLLIIRRPPIASQRA